MELSCAQLMGEYRELRKTIKQAIAVPLAMLNAVGTLVGMASSSATNLLNTALGIMSGSLWGMTSSEMLSSLYGLLDCMYVADSEMGPVVAGAIDDVENGRDISNGAKNMLQRQARGQFTGVVDNLEATPYGKLSKLNSAYGSMITNGGVPGALSALSQLEECIEEMCSAWQSVEELDAQKIKDSIGIAIDNKVKHVSDVVTGLPGAAVQQAKDFSTAYDAVKTQIASKTYTVIT